MKHVRRIFHFLRKTILTFCRHGRRNVVLGFVSPNSYAHLGDCVPLCVWCKRLLLNLTHTLQANVVLKCCCHSRPLTFIEIVAICHWNDVPHFPFFIFHAFDDESFSVFAETCCWEDEKLNEQKNRLEVLKAIIERVFKERRSADGYVEWRDKVFWHSKRHESSAGIAKSFMRWTRFWQWILWWILSSKLLKRLWLREPRKQRWAAISTTNVYHVLFAYCRGWTNIFEWNFTIALITRNFFMSKNERKIKRHEEICVKNLARSMMEEKYLQQQSERRKAIWPNS